MDNTVLNYVRKVASHETNRLESFPRRKGYLVIFFLALIYTLPSCLKDKINSLPPLTTKGANTFGCMIDKRPFVAGTYNLPGASGFLNGSYNDSTNLFKIAGFQEDKKGRIESVLFEVFITSGAGAYQIRANNDYFPGYVDYSNSNNSYYHDADNRGTVNVSFLDTSMRIVSGTFEMDLVIKNNSLSDPMKISEGRFDFKY